MTLSQFLGHFRFRISANSFRPWIVSAPVCKVKFKKEKFRGSYLRKYSSTFSIFGSLRYPEGKNLSKSWSWASLQEIMLNLYNPLFINLNTMLLSYYVIIEKSCWTRWGNLLSLQNNANFWSRYLGENTDIWE